MEQRHYLQEPGSGFTYGISLENPVFLVSLVLVVLIVAYIIFKKKDKKQ